MNTDGASAVVYTRPFSQGPPNQAPDPTVDENAVGWRAGDSFESHVPLSPRVEFAAFHSLFSHTTATGRCSRRMCALRSDI